MQHAVEDTADAEDAERDCVEEEIRNLRIMKLIMLFLYFGAGCAGARRGALVCQ